MLSLSNVAGTVIGLAHVVCVLHKVTLVGVTPFSVTPVAGVMDAVHEVAFSTWNLMLDVPTLDDNTVGVAVTGEAGPKDTFPVLPLPHPAPVELDAVAWRWPGAEPLVTAPVVYEQTVFAG